MLQPGLRSALGVMLVLAALAGDGRVGARTAAASDLRRTPVVEAVRKVTPSVVSIRSEKVAASNNRWPFSGEDNQRPRVNGMGTGVVIDGRGYILTNQHVVDKVQGLEVQLADGSTLPARVLQQDPAMDIALIKVEAGRPLQAMSVGTSSDLMLGEPVIAIGNAFGYDHTVSVGIVSAIGRDVTLSDDQVYRRLIQTDAAINPGNSGGPLVNIDGELIGINVAVRAGAQGIGFALPIDDVKRTALNMFSTRTLAATWHGLITGEGRHGARRTAVVSEIQSGSPAELSGFKTGDQIVKIGDFEVASPLDIERGLLDLRPGQKTNVVVMRSGKEEKLALEVQALPRSVPPTEVADKLWKDMGVQVVPVTRDYVAAVSPNFRGGLYVQNVAPNSPAAGAEIRRGDILVGMKAGEHEWETIRPGDVLYILKRPEVADAGTIQYYIVRRNEFIQGRLKTAAAPTTAARR